MYINTSEPIELQYTYGEFRKQVETFLRQARRVECIAANHEGATFAACDGSTYPSCKIKLGQLPIPILLGKRYWFCFMFDNHLWIGRQRSKMFWTELTAEALAAIEVNNHVATVASVESPI